MGAFVWFRLDRVVEGVSNRRMELSGVPRGSRFRLVERPMSRYARFQLDISSTFIGDTLGAGERRTHVGWRPEACWWDSTRPMSEDDPLRTRREVVKPVTAELAAAGFEEPVEIGRGGFGVVYRCTQVALDQTVAVKVLTAELDADNQARFLREQRAMGRMTGHPNIVTVLETGTTASERPYQSTIGTRPIKVLCVGCQMASLQGDFQSAAVLLEQARVLAAQATTPQIQARPPCGSPTAASPPRPTIATSARAADR